MSALSPHYPKLRTLVRAAGRSVPCHNEQMQQTTRASASLFDHLVGALLERRYLKLIKSVRLSVEALGFKGSFVAFALF